VMVRTIVGFLLLLFGLRWLNKAILRYGGRKAMRDEAEEFAETEEYLETHKAPKIFGLDRVGLTTSFGGVFLEGLEVVFIVIALGGLNSLPAATAGAAIALVAVIAVGIVARAPLTRVPENLMKFVVGVMLTAFGTFFAGEGIGIQWWHEDLVILPLLAIYLIVALAIVFYLRIPAATTVRRQTGAEKGLRVVGEEIWGLLVGDGSLAIIVLAVLFGVGFHVAVLGRNSDPYAEPLFVAGIIATVVIAIGSAAGAKKKAPPAHAGTSSLDGGTHSHAKAEQPVS